MIVFFLQDPAATSTLEAETGTREPESVTLNYKPSPLQVKIGKPLSHSRLRRHIVTGVICPFGCIDFPADTVIVKRARAKKPPCEMDGYGFR